MFSLNHAACTDVNSLVPREELREWISPKYEVSGKNTGLREYLERFQGMTQKQRHIAMANMQLLVSKPRKVFIEGITKTSTDPELKIKSKSIALLPMSSAEAMTRMDQKQRDEMATGREHWPDELKLLNMTVVRCMAFLYIHLRNLSDTDLAHLTRNQYGHDPLFVSKQEVDGITRVRETHPDEDPRSTEARRLKSVEIKWQHVTSASSICRRFLEDSAEHSLLTAAFEY